MGRNLKYKRQYPGASPYMDRHGKRRWRYRKGSFSAELGSDYGSTEFIRRYEAALEGHRIRGLIGASRTVPGSFSALVASFYQSQVFMGLGGSSKKDYRSVIEAVRVKHGSKRVEKLRKRHIQMLLAEKADTPSAANKRRKRLIQLLDHAIDLEWIGVNVALQTKAYKVTGTGFHTWDEGEIDRFFEAYELGTLPHLATTLMLYTGASRADACKMGWHSISGDRISYRRQKTEKSNGVLIDIPMHPDLIAAIDLCPRDNFTFLHTAKGAARSPNGLGNDMREWCDRIDLPSCSSHGLRKACSRRLAEAGATAPEIMAVTGHKNLQQVQVYIEKYSRSRAADSAIAKITNTEQKLTNHPKRFAKNPPKQLKNND